MSATRRGTSDGTHLRDEALDLIAHTRVEERDLLGAELTPDGWLVILGEAIAAAAHAQSDHHIHAGQSTREHARKAYARVAAAAAEAIAALDREG